MEGKKITVDAAMFQGKFEDKPNTQNIDRGAQEKTQSELSDDAYQEITKKVISITEEKLTQQANNKEKLREPLQKFISRLLIAQFSALLIILFFNDTCFNLETEIIKTYIVSVFAETLVGFIVMVGFAFSTDQEVELIKILNAVVSNFQVFGNNKDKNKEEKK